MSERISSWEKIDTRQQADLENIGRRALSLVDRKYGRGLDRLEAGEQKLTFHNGEHSRMVGWAAMRMCEKLELPSEYQHLARAIGYTHDIIQLKGVGTNEAESAAWLKASMDHFPVAIKAMAGKAILGTTPLFENGIMVGQRATELDYESILEETLAKSVACADLSELFSPIGPYMSHQLLKEFNPGADQDKLIEKVVGFQRNQCELVERYRYPLAEGEVLFGSYRSDVVDFTQETLRNLESGAIESWEELVKRDLLFKRKLETDAAH